MSLINISKLTFGYDGSFDNIFEDVSFQIDTDWKLGFTGRNGRGKTTFLKLLLGAYAYQGNISASVEFDYFPFAVADKSVNTIDVVDSICFDYEYWMLSKDLSLLDVSEDVLYRPFETLSNGEQTKVMLAALFLKENNFLLIDEPTNHLDMAGREIVSRYLNKQKGFILVSHDRTFLDQCIDHVLSINKTNIEVQKGNFSTWQQNKAYQDQFELGENEKLKKDISRLTKAAKQTSQWSDKVEQSKILPKKRDAGVKPDKGAIGHKAAKMMKRSKTTEGRIHKSIDEKSKLLHNIETADDLSIQYLKHHNSKLAEIIDLSILYEQPVCSAVSFDVVAGERVALFGKNGSGKSSILKLMAGELIPHTGSVRLASNLVVSYVPQDISFLSGNLRDYANQYGIDESQFKTILRKLDFSREQFEKQMEDYSDGQKKKVLIARSLCEKAHLYIWDEPLNYIDVLSRIQIENLLLQQEPPMIFVEHDRSFVNAVSTKQVEL